jgi:exopolyphosphatase/guanosine-5'-triphosphate,3'-diphosphate pyrophosphatase
LVLGQHGKIRKLDLTDGDSQLIVSLACLRLAIILCHSRNEPILKGIKKLAFIDNTLQLTVLDSWLEKHPQSAYLLEEEMIAWKKTHWSLSVITNDK